MITSRDLKEFKVKAEYPLFFEIWSKYLKGLMHDVTRIVTKKNILDFQSKNDAPRYSWNVADRAINEAD